MAWHDELGDWLKTTDGHAKDLIDDPVVGISSFPPPQFWEGYRAALKDVDTFRTIRIGREDAQGR